MPARPQHQQTRTGRARRGVVQQRGLAQPGRRLHQDHRSRPALGSPEHLGDDPTARHRAPTGPAAPSRGAPPRPTPRQCRPGDRTAPRLSAERTRAIGPTSPLRWRGRFGVYDEELRGPLSSAFPWGIVSRPGMDGNNGNRRRYARGHGPAPGDQSGVGPVMSTTAGRARPAPPSPLGHPTDTPKRTTLPTPCVPPRPARRGALR